MALSDPRIVYGVHSITPYSRTTGMPYGILKVIGSCKLELSSAVEELFGGSSKFSWAAESKTISTNIAAKVKAYPGFLFQLFLGASVTDSGVDATGTLTALTNKLGTTCQSATIGISTVTITPSTGAADLKFTKYVVIVTSASTVNVYGMSDIDFARGTAGSYQADTLKLLATNVTITTGATTDLAGWGIRFTGGSGTIGMTTNDTATFEVKPPSTSSSLIIVGGATATFPNFGALMLAQKRSTGEIFEVDAHKCVGIGLPIAFDETAFSMPELKMTCAYDSTLDRVFTIRHILP